MNNAFSWPRLEQRTFIQQGVDMSRISVSTLIVIVLLAACSKAPVAEPKDQGVKATASAETAKAAGRTRMESPMFDGYLPVFENVLRSDTVREDGKGRSVRSVVFEYIGTHENELAPTIDAELASLGYKPKPWQKSEDKWTTQYVKKAGQRIGVVIQPANERLRMRSSNANGFVRFFWVEEAKDKEL